MLKKSMMPAALLALIFLAACTNNNNTTTTVVNNNYLMAEFQQGILPYTGYNGCIDTNMASLAPYNTYNFGITSEGSMGYYGPGAYMTRYLVKFDIGSIPSGVTVKKAYLTVYAYITGGAGTLSAFRKTGGWLEGSNDGSAGTPSWNSTTGGAPFDSTASGTVTIAGANYYTFELNTAMVQDWVNNSSVNYGVIIKGDDEAVNSWIWCYFKEATEPSTRPKLTVYYTIQ